MSPAQVIIQWPTFQFRLTVQELYQDQLAEPSKHWQETFPKPEQKKIRSSPETGEKSVTSVVEF